MKGMWPQKFECARFYWQGLLQCSIELFTSKATHTRQGDHIKSTMDEKVKPLHFNPHKICFKKKCYRKSGGILKSPSDIHWLHYIQNKSEMLLLVSLFNIIVVANTSIFVSIFLKGKCNFQHETYLPIVGSMDFHDQKTIVSYFSILTMTKDV